MKNFKKALALLLALSMIFALAACGGSGSSGSAGSSSDAGSTAAAPVKTKHAKIGVALYQDSGAAVDAVKAYLKSLESALNCEFAYTVLSTNDEALNVTKIQELISAGCDGIICTMDGGTEAILKECADAGVYLAGYLSDYDTSYRNNYDNVFKHPNFLGTVGDGPCGDHTTRGYDFFNSVIEYNERNPENPIRHVAGTVFPAFAFPYSKVNFDQFVEKVNEYNAANPDKAIEVDPFNEETDVLMFRPVDSTYFSKHPGIDAIVAFNAGSFVYPSMVSAGVADTMKLFAAGYNDGDDAVFGSKGAYQQEMVCASESVTYPLVLLLNKINGVSFPDQPAEAERRDCSTLIINSDEDMAKFKSCLYLTFDPANAFLTPEEVLNLTAFGNPNATYAGLCEILDHMTIEDIK